MQKKKVLTELMYSSEKLCTLYDSIAYLLAAVLGIHDSNTLAFTARLNHSKVPGFCGCKMRSDHHFSTAAFDSW